jgi:hypothetical protein
MLSERFLVAMQLSFSLHKNQVRKSTGDIPYFSHIMSVTALVQEAGGDEDVQIAALLHDAVEDQGGEATLQLIREQFGNLVADVVLFCSDSVERDAEGNKLPWRERKEAHLQHLRAIERPLDEVQQRGVLVMIADKLHNARTTYEAVLVQGDSVYERFRGGKEGTLWYLRESASALALLYGNKGITRRLKETVALLRDDQSTTKKIIRLHGHHVDSYYDASTPLLEKEALVQIFEDLKSDGCYDIIQDDAYLQRVHKDLQELEELQECLQKGTVPSALVYGVTQQVKNLAQKREECKELQCQVELYAKAVAGDKSAARELVSRRRGYDSERWYHEMMCTSAFEE